jgi:hypothetical protein
MSAKRSVSPGVFPLDGRYFAETITGVDTDRASTVDPAASLRAGVHASARGGVQSDGQSVYDELARIILQEAERQEREAKAS